MTLQEAKETVVLAGKMLVESGLIARTWGNVSCRISESQFVITPSGRDYLSLTPEEIVAVAVSDCSYSGNIKPSSEKGVHAEVYKLHPNVHFVIHTHQDQASAIGASALQSIKVSDKYPSLHGEVLCAAYALPGTKKLRRNVAEALARSKGNAVIMKNHGVVCFGANYDETFKTAHELEDACKDFIHEQSKKISTTPSTDTAQIDSSVPSKPTEAARALKQGSHCETMKNNNTQLHWESSRKDKGFRLDTQDMSFDIALDHPLQNNSFPASSAAYMEAEIHSEIYKSNPAIHHIIHSNTPGISVISCIGIPKLLPLLDDFAQIAGTSVKIVERNPSKLSSALKNASAVFIKDNGALCCGVSKSDAQAVSMVVEKNCNAYITSSLFGKVKPINHLECQLMRFVYLKKYSKQVNKK